MKVCGIVAEFNPLHNGHKYLIDQVRTQLKPDFLIVVMSGNYVQRGEVASFDKWQRARMALDMGIDLIVELPFQYAVAPAEQFAKGAIGILNDLNCDYIAFGTEASQFNYLKAAEETISNSEAMSKFTDYSKSYATQINEFLLEELGLKIDNPNQMLGFNYALQIVKNNYEIKLFPISRMNVSHDSAVIKDNIASASQIRQELALNHDVSNLVPVKINISDMVMNDNNVFELLKYRVITSSVNELSQIYQMVEGLENRLKSVISEADSFDELLDKLKSKRYTFARLRRLMLYILLNVTEDDIIKSQDFIHVLGFNEHGRDYLNQVKKSVTIPLVTKVSKNIGDDGVMTLQVKVDEFISMLNHTEQNFKRNPEMELEDA